MERYIGFWGLLFLSLSIVLQNVNLVDCFVWYGDQRQILHSPSVRQRIMKQHLPDETTPSPFPYTFWRRRRTSANIYGNTKQKLQSVLVQLQKLEKQLAHKVRSHHPRAASTYSSRSSKTRVPYDKQYQIRKFDIMKTAIPESSNQHVISPRIVNRFIINGGTNKKPPNQVNRELLPKIRGHTGILKQRNWYNTVAKSRDINLADSLYDISRLKTELSNLNTNFNGYVGIPDESFPYSVEFSGTKPKISKGQFVNIPNMAYKNKYQKFTDEFAGVNSIASSTQSGVASLDGLGESSNSQNSHLSDSMSFNGFPGPVRGDSNIFGDAVIDVESPCDGSDTKTCILDSDCRFVCDGLHKCYRHLCIVLESDIPTTSMVGTWQDEQLESMRGRSNDEII